MEELPAENNPQNPELGSRTPAVFQEIYIEQEDFMEDPPKKYFRLSPGKEVRLKHAYIIKCERVVKDEKTGEVVELHCNYDPQTRSGLDQSGRKVKGTLHWVSARHAVPAEVRLYDHLFINASDQAENGEQQEEDMILNPDSLERLTNCLIEPSVQGAKPGDRFQFMRQGYFCVDLDSTADRLVFNRIVSLKDSWAKQGKK